METATEGINKFKYLSTNNTSEFLDHYELELKNSNSSENEWYFFKILGGNEVKVY